MKEIVYSYCATEEAIEKGVSVPDSEAGGKPCGVIEKNCVGDGKRKMQGEQSLVNRPDLFSLEQRRFCRSINLLSIYSGELTSIEAPSR
jgi:hypothetical protein